MSFVAAGVGVAGLGISAYQTIHGADQAKKAQNALKNQQTPVYTPNKSILDYYQEAKNRYETSPYNTAQFQLAQQGIGRNQAAGLTNLQNSRSALGGVGNLVQQSNDANLKAVAQTEAQRSNAFNQYARAAGAEGADISKQFQINKMLPYTQNRNLYAQEASGYTQLENAGMYGLQNSAMALGKVNWGKIFGGDGSPSTGVTTPYSGGGQLPSYTPMTGQPQPI